MVIQLLNDLLMELENNPRRYILKLSQEIEDFANYCGRCMLCGSKLMANEHQEDRGEYFGFDSQETMYIRECSNPECCYMER
mgnify:CR=1 FL=1